MKLFDSELQNDHRTGDGEVFDYGGCCVNSGGGGGGAVRWRIGVGITVNLIHAFT
ncbi:hypothetical protein TIFTF001_006808 [Ficus carica]|uniref:Uncharacterized protein n=1 Tax=Ficus carica TaxID=3494 RepID=A0AA87ZRY3_FICCA|nr:hypothetical protein TIFTF001_006808 [Ficus carica]